MSDDLHIILAALRADLRVLEQTVGSLETKLSSLLAPSVEPKEELGLVSLPKIHSQIFAVVYEMRSTVYKLNCKIKSIETRLEWKKSH